SRPADIAEKLDPGLRRDDARVFPQSASGTAIVCSRTIRNALRGNRNLMLDSQLARLAVEAARLGKSHLRTLLAAPERSRNFSRRAGPLLLDFSRQKLDETALAALGEIAEAMQWSKARDAMFRGDPIN